MKIEISKRLLVIMIISSFILLFFHGFRFLNTQVMPFYDQYLYVGNIEHGEGGLLDIWMSTLENPVFMMRFLPFVVGVLNVLLIYGILKNFMKKKNHLFFTMLLYVLSPAFLFVHGTYNSLFLPVLFLLLGTFLLLRQKFLASMIIFLFSFILNQGMFYLVLIILSVFYDHYKSSKKNYSLIAIILVSLVYVSIHNLLPNDNLLSKIFTDFGANFGLSVFTMILASVGLIISWEKKEKNIMLYLLLSSFFISSLYDRQVLFYLDMVLIYYGGMGLYYLTRKKWESKTLKNYVIILLVCGLIFSAGSYVAKVSEMNPTKQEITSLEWLGANEGLVLSHYEYGHLIKAVSGMETYTDNTYFLNSRDKTKINKTGEIFNSRDLETIFSFFDKNNIKYVWINKEMTDGQVWSKEDQGILLIFDISSNFTKIYEHSDIEIWQYN